MPTKTAIICEKWEVPFYIKIEAEHQLPLRQRSYAHFVATKPALVAAKCLATEWILSNQFTHVGSVTEFFGGVGLFATIVEKLIAPENHTIYEIDDRCLVQLHEMFADSEFVDVHKNDARKALLTDKAQVMSLDFPNFTILDIRDGCRWSEQFDKVFKGGAQAIIFTDTSSSYFHIHKHRYSEFFGEELKTIRDYTQAFSNYLFKRYGYSISRAAYRGRNACYYFCVPGEELLEEQSFPLEGSEHGFQWK